MKKNLLVLAGLLFFAIQASAQIGPGKILLGGSLGFSSKDTENDNDWINSRNGTETTFELMPRIGFGLSENWVIGAGIGYQSTKFDRDGSDYEEKTNMFVFSPYARYYKMVSEKVGFFGEGTFAFGTGKYKPEPTGNKKDLSSFAVGVTPGITYFITEKIAFEATMGFLGYSQIKAEVDGTDDPESEKSEFGLNVDLTTLNFGVQFVL
ncbi:outer membrane beta-barrel protein [Rapidithrix thailandica]|uniref:Outer membrane beta-barrel protein n=1 Tax=Rapidithrix thailandica TaxID=413964 RepID=A0AAW9S138_9BACT